MSADPQSFPDSFCGLTGYSPMRWQNRLCGKIINGEIPAALDLPTGRGKTSVMAIWLVARALAGEDALKAIPRRLVYIVDRRAVVDQATEEAEKLRQALNSDAAHLKGSLGLSNGTLPISTLRGAHVDNREWLDDPAAPAIVVGTIDMIGSRFLFEGYGVSRKMRPYHAGLLGADTLIVLDEAHLVPPFEALLWQIANGAEQFGSRAEFDAGLVPPFSFCRCRPPGALSRPSVAARRRVRFVSKMGIYLTQSSEAAFLRKRLSASSILTAIRARSPRNWHTRHGSLQRKAANPPDP